MLILKTVKIICFYTLLQVLILSDLKLHKKWALRGFRSCQSCESSVHGHYCRRPVLQLVERTAQAEACATKSKNASRMLALWRRTTIYYSESSMRERQLFVKWIKLLERCQPCRVLLSRVQRNGPPNYIAEEGPVRRKEKTPGELARLR